MYQHLTKLLLAGVVAVAILALGSTSILSPAWAAKIKTCADGNTLACIEDKLDEYLAQQVKIVFLTSSTHTGDSGGVAGADAICRGLAADAGLPGLYRAWIATDETDDPASRFFKSPAPYILVSGDLVADNWADLVAPTNLHNPIDVDEVGSPGAGALVWTNISDDGTSAGSVDSCQGWTDASVGMSGKVGFSSGIGISWTVDETNSCNTSLKLYCFGQ